MKITLKQLRDLANYYYYQSYDSAVADDIEIDISVIEEDLEKDILQSVLITQTTGQLALAYDSKVTVHRSVEVYPAQDKRPSITVETRRQNIK